MEQWRVSVVVRVEAQVFGYFDDYVGIKAGEWTKGIF